MDLPIKGYLLFTELMERWNVNADAIFHFVSNRRLFPSIFLNDHFDKYIHDPIKAVWAEAFSMKDLDYLNDDEDEDEVRDLIWSETKLNGFYYLSFHRESLHSCYADTVKKTKKIGEEFWLLPFKVSLNINENHFKGDDRVVFLNDEVFIFERANEKIIRPKLKQETTQPISSTKNIEIDKIIPQHKREKNNLHKVIAALCTELKHDVDSPYKTAQIIQNQLEQLKLSLSENTVAKILNEVKLLLEEDKKTKRP